MKTYIVDGIHYPTEYQWSSRKRSWVSLEQINVQHWVVVAKISEVLFTDSFHENAKEYCRSCLDFLIDWEFLSWKQYDSIMSILPNKDYGTYSSVLGKYVSTRMHKGGHSLTYFGNNKDIHQSIRVKGQMTDKQFDGLHSRIFGHNPIFQRELDGEVVKYDYTGRRYFALPTSEDLHLHNHVSDFGSERVMRSILRM